MLLFHTHSWCGLWTGGKMTHACILAWIHRCSALHCRTAPFAPQVSSEGDVVYAFQPDFKGRIRGKSVSLRLKPVLAKVLETLSFLVRSSGGHNRGTGGRIQGSSKRGCGTRDAGLRPV